MEEAAQQQQQQQQQQQLMLQQRQQLLLFQQLQQQKQQQQQQQHQAAAAAAAAISRFPSNIDAHLRPPGLHYRPITPPQQSQQQQQTPNPNPNPNPNPALNPSSAPNQQQLQNSSPNLQQQQQQKPIRPPANQAELQMAYQDAWRVCHPDFKRPFSSLEDACERLLPYHVVADYEAEEDDRILDSDTTGQMLSRSQQWDHNIAAKVAEFTATFEKQALAFNIISRKRALGEFRSEERLMVEQALLQEERRALFEVRAEIESREKAGREAHEAKMRMAAMVQAEQARAESQAHSEILARTPLRGRALGSQGNDIGIGHDAGDQEQGVSNPEAMMNGWGNNIQRDEKEPSEDFLNDEETDNGETSMQTEWREAGEFDLNSR